MHVQSFQLNIRKTFKQLQALDTEGKLWFLLPWKEKADKIFRKF